MPSFSVPAWLSLDPVTGNIAVPLWAGIAAAVLLVLLAVLAFRRSRRPGVISALLRTGFILAAVFVVLTYLERTTAYEHAAERRALEARNTELTERGFRPNSGLACLDAGAGEAVEVACEKVVFARPESVAAAVAYMEARLGLLADGLDYSARIDHKYELSLYGMRRALELDRYGIVAHVLMRRHGCTTEYCPSFALLRDTSIIKSNMKARTFDGYVSRYLASWEEKTPAPMAQQSAPAQPQTTGSTTPSAQSASASAGKYDFPSAASIPPVSIMNTEPKLPPQPEATEASAAPAAAPAEKPKVPAPPRRPQNQAVSTTPR